MRADARVPAICPALALPLLDEHLELPRVAAALAAPQLVRRAGKRSARRP
jgi:hypothetical protein